MPAAAVGLMADPKVVRSEAPTAVLWGTADPFFGVEWAHWLGGVIPGCSVARGGEVTELEDAKLFLPRIARRPSSRCSNGSGANAEAQSPKLNLRTIARRRSLSGGRSRPEPW
jgi:hypothetical protein